MSKRIDQEIPKIKPIAVLISDVHYNIHTLKLADAAMRMAITKANELNISLIVAGDLHDTKANLRGECVNAMLETFNLIKTDCFILIGNHDLINEKSTENSLEFLDEMNDRVWLVKDHERPYFAGVECIAYHSDINKLKTRLDSIPKGSIIIMHQGLQGSLPGDYIIDRTAIPKDWLKGQRVISGHYHNRQSITLENGIFDYIGNPYTLGFGEANDPPKGYQILMEDGTLEFVSTNLREHKIIEITANELIGDALFLGSEEDLVWVKIHGTAEELASITRSEVAKYLDINQSFKLDLIPTQIVTAMSNEAENLNQAEILDKLIDSATNSSEEQKERLKLLWKHLMV